MAANVRRMIGELKRPEPRRLTDAEIGQKATEKLRTQLFAKYTARELGVILVSERVKPLTRGRDYKIKDSFTGLDYLIIHRACFKLSVIHVGGVQFILYLYDNNRSSWGSEQVLKSYQIEFKDLDWQVMKYLIVTGE